MRRLQGRSNLRVQFPGPVPGFDKFREQQHQIFLVVDLDLGPRWELNFGAGVGLTPSTDRL